MEELNGLLETWKAVRANTDPDRLRAYSYADGYCDCLQTALKIIKKPCNTQMQIDAPVACPLYTDYKKSCQALKDHEAELRHTT